MQKRSAPAVAALALAVLAGAASAETRALSGFTHVAASGGYRVEVSQGPGFSVVVDGADAAQIETRLQRDRLRITQRNRWFGFGHRKLDAVVRVTMPDVSGLSASAGVELLAGAIAADDVGLAAAQGGLLSVHELRAGSVSLAAAQGGMIHVAGACQTVDASAAMGGVIEAEGLDCASADVSAAMGGVAEIHARERVDASAAMGGVIDVSGAPVARNTSAAMGGDIEIR